MNHHLLHIDSSLRTDASRSRKLSAYYADAWRAAHPDGTVTYRDLTADPLPHLDEAAFTTNFTLAEDRTPEQRAARELTDVIVGEVPGVTLGDDGGTLGGRTLVFTTAAGGGYGPGTPREGWDHRQPWLRHAFEQLGVSDPIFVGAELTLARESPKMIPLDLGAAEDESLANAHGAIDALFARTGVPA